MGKITQLAELGSLSNDDLLLAVDAPGGSPATRKVTVANARKLIGFTTGSILFISGESPFESTKLFWNNTDNILHIGTVGASGQLRVYDSVSGGTGAYGLFSSGGPGTIRFSGGQGSAATGNTFEFNSGVRPSSDNVRDLGEFNLRFKNCFLSGYVALGDGITPPGTLAGSAFIYVDTADGDLKVKFGDGTTKTIATDT